MLPNQVTLLRATLPLNPVPLLSPVEVGVDETLTHFTSYLLANARLVTVEHRGLELFRDALREYCSLSPQPERIKARDSLSLSVEPYLLAARFSVWNTACFVRGGFRLGCAWLVGSVALATRFKRQPGMYRPIAPQTRTLAEDAAVDDSIFAVRAALDNYDPAFIRYIERLEAYIARLTADRKPSLPFKTAEAISLTIQRLFQAIDAVLMQPSDLRQQAVADLAAAGSSASDELSKPDLAEVDRTRLAHRIHLIVYLWNLLADPSDSTSLELRYRLENVHPAVEWDCAVAKLLDRKRDQDAEWTELFPIKRVLQLVQRIVYIDIPCARSPSRPSLHRLADPAKPLLDLLETLVTDPALDKVDLTSLCMLFYDAYEAHKRLARVEGELWEGIVAFVVARRNWRRAVRERRGAGGP